MNEPRRRRRKKHRFLSFLAWLLVIILLLGAAAAIYFYILLNKMDTQDFPTADTDLGISSSPPEVEKSGLGNSEIVNIALFGIDRRGDEPTRSDTIMVLTVDKPNGKLKLSSIMRDSLVEIEGYGQGKLNSAYAYGGPELAVKTLNQNFGLNIREYVTVDFHQLAEIIDALGGVEIEVSEEERQNANQSILEQAQVSGLEEDYIESPGLQTLSGTQAVAFSRIRYVGNADFERTSRQREVLRAVFDKAMNLKATEYISFANTLLPMMETSLDVGDVLSLADILLKKPSLQDVRFPTNGDLIGDGSIVVDGQSCVYFDIQSASQKLHDFIYLDIDPTTDADRLSDGKPIE